MIYPIVIFASLVSGEADKSANGFRVVVGSQRNAHRNPPQCLPKEDGLAAVQCCDNNGTSAGYRPKPCNESKNISHTIASNRCPEGKRLCTEDEVTQYGGRYTGCQIDNLLVWTSTPCDVLEPGGPNCNLDEVNCLKTDGCKLLDRFTYCSPSDDADDDEDGSCIDSQPKKDDPDGPCPPGCTLKEQRDCENIKKWKCMEDISDDKDSEHSTGLCVWDTGLGEYVWECTGNYSGRRCATPPMLSPINSKTCKPRHECRKAEWASYDYCEVTGNEQSWEFCDEGNKETPVIDHILKYVRDDLLPKFNQTNKTVCEGNWLYQTAEDGRPALYVHKDCVENLRRLGRRSETKFMDCQKRHSKQQNGCDFTLYELRYASNNSGKYVVEPGFNGKSKKSFLKRMTGYDPTAAHRLRNETNYLYSNAEQMNTTHLLQWQSRNSTPHWLATEFVEGVPLKDMGTVTSYSVKQVFRMVKDMLRAYATFHCAGYVHGDAHAGNVMIPEAGKVKLIDFDRVSSIDGVSNYNGKNMWDTEVEWIKFHFITLLSFHGRYLGEFHDDYTLNDRLEGTCSLDKNTRDFLEKLKSKNGANYLFQRDGTNKNSSPKYCEGVDEKLTVEALFDFANRSEFDDAEDCVWDNPYYKDLSEKELEEEKEWEAEEAERWKNKWWVVKATLL